MSDSRGFRRPAPLAAAMFVTWAAAMPAAAQGGPPGTPEERRACMPDVVRLCQDFVPDADKVNACLFGKQSELSPACRTMMLGHAPAARPRCRSQSPRRCGSRPGRGWTHVTPTVASAGRNRASATIS